MTARLKPRQHRVHPRKKNTRTRDRARKQPVRLDLAALTEQLAAARKDDHR